MGVSLDICNWRFPVLSNLHRRRRLTRIFIVKNKVKVYSIQYTLCTHFSVKGTATHGQPTSNMFAVKSTPLLLRSPKVLTGGKDNSHRRAISRATGWQRVQIQAMISGGDSQTTTSSPLDSKESNGSVPRGSRSGSGNDNEVIQVKAVVRIRKKMKENISGILEDQWEHFVNGFGQGIQIQLISEQIDSGLFLTSLLLSVTNFFNCYYYNPSIFSFFNN